jgi:hypothetical protein
MTVQVQNLALTLHGTDYSAVACLIGDFTCTVIRFVAISAKVGISTFVGLNGTLAETKIRTSTLMCPKCVF